MGRKWSNRALPGALHYVTAVVSKRRRVFNSENYCIGFLEELQSLRAKSECKVIAFVVMPDHVHLIVNPRDGDISAWCGWLKANTALRLIPMAPRGTFNSANGEENEFWQESFKAIPLWSNWMIWQKINYIHNNPVRAKLVDAARDYRWTSFRSFYKLGEEDPLLEVDQEWSWPEDIEKLTKAMGEWEQELRSKHERK